MKHWCFRLARYVRPQWRGILLLLGLIVLGVVFEVLKPWPLKLIVDHVLAQRELPPAVSWLTWLPKGSSPIGLLGWLTVGTILVFLASKFSILTRSYVQAGIGCRMSNDLGAHLFTHLQRLSLLFHSRQPVGDLLRRVTTESRCVQELALGVILPALASLLTLASMVGIMWNLDRTLSLVALFAAPLLGAFIWIFSWRIAARSYEQQQIEGEFLTVADQTLTAIPVVQAFSREEHGNQRFRNVSDRAIGSSFRVTASQLQFGVCTGSVTAFSTAMVMVIGGLHVLQGSLTVGSLLVALTYVASLYAPLETLTQLTSGFAVASARARWVFEMLDANQEVKDSPGARPLPPRAAGEGGHVRLQGVTFGYEPGSPVLHEVSLDARPGETVALVGRTGAGKSTLVSLIPRFYDPWEGKVTFDGTDLRELQLSSLRAQVALVLQEPFLLPLTVAENIAYGRPMARHEEVVAAAVAANADEFIRALPEGYDTVIGERGATLSGGEKQRVAIARALLKNAPVLILDEPTAALDIQTETQVLQALERLTRGRTTFLIAHQLTTVQQADRIVVLDQGRVMEQGTHGELLAARGRYRELFEQRGQPHGQETTSAAAEPLRVQL